MKSKRKIQKKAKPKNSANGIKRKIFFGIRYKNKIKNKKKIKKNKQCIQLENFDNILNFSFCGYTGLNTENNNTVETNINSSNIEEIDNCNFEGIINLKINNQKKISFAIKQNNFSD